MARVQEPVQGAPHTQGTDEAQEAGVPFTKARRYVSEYWDKFIQFSRYTPVDVAVDESKQDHFRLGLN